MARRLLAVLVTAVVMATGAVLTPAAHAAVSRTVTLSLSPTTIVLGQSTTLRGSVSKSPVGTPVVIDVKRGTKWVRLTTVRTTTRAGAYKAVVKPTATGTKTYRARVVAKKVGTKRLAAAKSPARTLVVKKKPVVTRTVTLTVPSEVLAYEETEVSGTVSRSPAGAVVTIECNYPIEGWSACGGATTAGDGTFTDLDFRIAHVGWVPVRARVAQQSTPTATLAAAASTTKQVLSYGADDSGRTRLASVTPLRSFTDDRESAGSSVSDDGRFVAFVSASSQLVDGVDTAGHRNVFVRDMDGETTRLVSEGLDGEPMQQLDSGDPVSAVISGNGRYVAYTTTSPDLVAGDTNGAEDVFVTDLETGTTERASLTNGGLQVSAGPFVEYDNLSISDDGRKVLFTTDVNGLVPEDTNGKYDAFVRTLSSPRSTTLVTRNGSGELLDNGGGAVADLAGDGGSVVFYSSSTNIGPSSGALPRGLYHRTLGSSPVVTPIYFQTGDPATGLATGVDMSDDGRTVVFTGEVPSLNGFSGTSPLHVWRAGSGGAVAVSRDQDGDLVTVARPVVSGDGSTAAFSSAARDLAAVDPRPTGQELDDETYVYDLTAKTTVLASITSGGDYGGSTSPTGKVGGPSYPTGLSQDGTRISFDSRSTWLIKGDDSNFTDRDVFWRRLR